MYDENLLLSHILHVQRQAEVKEITLTLSFDFYFQDII